MENSTSNFIKFHPSGPVKTLQNFIQNFSIPEKILNFNPTNFEHFSDKDLYKYCKIVGFNARIWSRKFIAAIPEVAKRRLYKKCGYCSIREFAAKLAGVSHDSVDEVLRVNEKFKELPKMKALIGEVGLSKLRVVACVANKKNEKDLSEKVKNMTKSSLEIYVREMIRKTDGRTTLPGEETGNSGDRKIPQTEEQIGLFGEDEKVELGFAYPQIHDKKTFTIQIDEETEFELRKFKLQLEKERKERVDWNFALKEMVKRATNEQKASASGPRTQLKKVIPELKDAGGNKQIVTRYIPAKTKRDLQEKHNSHCAYKGCNKPAEQFHHQERFAIKRNHENLMPLCKSHHDFVHQNSIEQQNAGVDTIFNIYKMKYCL
ncbi:hypothetical protein JW911_05025 [Candidatus Peregrinibacteria bacterium]|nr:hypothetical protein [Candidatus Peregrinibacteria bacterium]